MLPSDYIDLYTYMTVLMVTEVKSNGKSIYCMCVLVSMVVVIQLHSSVMRVLSITISVDLNTILLYQRQNKQSDKAVHLLT